MKISQLFLKISRKIKFFVFIPFWGIQAIYFDFLVERSDKHIKTKSDQKNILIIKLDAIGDYVLFRNFLEQVKKSVKFKNYKIHLLGNIRYKDLALQLDKNFVDEFIWIDPSKLLNRFWIVNRENLSLILGLNQNEYEYILNPTFTRQYLVDKLIVKNINAFSKVGFIGDSTNTPGFLSRGSERFYTKMIKVEKNNVFEFYRNKTFFEEVLGQQIVLDRPIIRMGKTILDPGSRTAGWDDKMKYIVIFPGAGTVDKQWPPLNFAKIIDYIESKYPGRYSFIIMGGKGDVAASKQIMSNIKSQNVVNQTGQTNLVELIQALSEASLLICNDTGAAHIAAALNTKTIFLLKGNGEFGRFGPYPPEIDQNITAIFPPKIGYNTKTYAKLLGKRFFTTEINDIGVDTVQGAIDQIL